MGNLTSCTSDDFVSFTSGLTGRFVVKTKRTTDRSEDGLSVWTMTLHLSNINPVLKHANLVGVGTTTFKDRTFPFILDGEVSRSTIRFSKTHLTPGFDVLNQLEYTMRSHSHVDSQTLYRLDSRDSFGYATKLS